MQNTYKAFIITIGNELLNGDTIDTNSVWIAKELNSIGIDVMRKIAVPDVWDDIWQTLDEAFTKANVIIITGGLGPTADDITKPLLCKYFDSHLVINEEALNNVKRIFEQLKRPLLQRNINQAQVPKNCTVIQNHNGTAPGMLFEKNNVICVSMPGVPLEMEYMMTSQVLPLIKNKFNNQQIINEYIITQGIGESFLAEKIASVENTLPNNISLAYLPHFNFVKLRLTLKTSAQDKQGITQLHDIYNTIKNILHDNIISLKNETIVDCVHQLLLENKKTVAVAESCTAGYLGALLTNKDGASQFFKGGFITYQDDIKNSLLDIDKNIIHQYSAVSQQVAIEMAKATCVKCNADYGLAITGYLSNPNNDANIILGKVIVGLYAHHHSTTHTLQLRYKNRIKNRERAAESALNLLREFILQDLNTNLKK